MITGLVMLVVETLIQVVSLVQASVTASFRSAAVDYFSRRSLKELLRGWACLGMRHALSIIGSICLVNVPQVVQAV